MLFLDRVIPRLRLIFWDIKFMIILEPKLILEFMLLLSVLALRTHCHCCWLQCGVKPLYMSSWSERAVTAKRWVRVQPCDGLMYWLTAYKGAPYEELFNFYDVGRHVVVQLFWLCITACCYQVHKIKTKIK